MQVEGQTVSGAIMNNTYRIVLSRHDEPNIEVTGHYWAITEFYKIGESRMIAWTKETKLLHTIHYIIYFI